MLMHPTPLLVERRFPVALDAANDGIRALYDAAKQARWDPFRDFDWRELERLGLSPDEYGAMRLAYSRRAWQEYTALAETPALLIRFCLEQGREADPKYFLTVRNTEEAWHIECFDSIATTCGGVLPQPESGTFAAVFNQRRDQVVLNADTSLDAYVATYCAFEDLLELKLAERALANAKVPVIRAVLERIVSDRRRHEQFGWLYVNARAAQWSAAERAVVIESINRYMLDAVFAGYQCVSFAPAGVADEYIEAEAILAARGLGGTNHDDERAALRQTVALAHRRLFGFDMHLPWFKHPVHKTF